MCILLSACGLRKNGVFVVRRTLLGASIQPCIKCPCPFSPFFFHNAVCCSWQKGSCHVFTQRQVKAVFKMNALCSCTTHQHQLVRGHSLLEIACRHAYCSAPQFIVPFPLRAGGILKRQPRPCTARVLPVHTAIVTHCSY